MVSVQLDIDPRLLGALRLAPAELAREIRIAAAIQWYAEGLISQGRAAELAALSRWELLDELRRRRVPACQASLEELREEMRGL